jgi:hypothetical protein
MSQVCTPLLSWLPCGKISEIGIPPAALLRQPGLVVLTG